MNPKTLELLEAALSVLGPNEFPFAIGGGVAVNIHGFERETKDVDVFLLDESRHEVLRAFRKSGFSIETVMSPTMYIVTPPGWKGKHRIDLMFSVGDPEESGIELAEHTLFEGQEVMVFTPEFLVLTKFYSNRFQDLMDIAILYELGSFDPKEVLRLLTEMSGEEAAGSFSDFLKETRRERISRPRPKKRT